MKKLQTMILAMLAIFAFCAVTASAASAEETLLAEWLANGSGIGASLPIEASGSVLLEDAGVPIAGLCDGILVGTVSANGVAEVTEVLNLAKEQISSTLTGLALTSANGDCVNENGCSPPIEVFPEGLPWRGQLFLAISTGKILHTGINGGYTIKCSDLGLKIEDTCGSPDTLGEFTNDPVTGDAETPEGSIAEPLGTCTIGGNGKDVYETDELVTVTLGNGELLTVSSE